MISTRTIIVETARTLAIVGWVTLTVEATKWALGGLPDWMCGVYLIGVSTAAVAMSLYVREGQLE